MVPFVSDLLRVALLSLSVMVINENKQHTNLAGQTILDRTRTYDFIVVGGGTAGSIVASRLSKNEKVKVLLLEEGGSETVSTDIPSMDMLNLMSPNNVTNEFLVEPQVSAGHAYPNRQFNILTGRVLGGGSSINGLVYNRGGKNDFDGWAKDYKAEGWSYDEVLPYFKKSQDQTDDKLKDRYHGTGGFMTVLSPSLKDATAPYKLLTDTFMLAATQLGYKQTDVNGANQIGSAIPQRILKNGRRLSTATAYLRPNCERHNLHILTAATVYQINFENKRASGVEFLYRGNKIKVKATREVILSAGSVGSPKLLLLSGIGPKKDLDNLGINMIADLPVGLNFHDHVKVSGLDFTVNASLFTHWQDLFTFDNIARFYQSGEGPLASNFYQHQGALLNIRTSIPTNGTLFGPSDVFISPSIIPPPSKSLGLKLGEPLKDDIVNALNPLLAQSTLNLQLSLNHVKSRGWLTLRSKDPMDKPIINPRYLTEREDVERLIEAYRVATKIGTSAAFQALGAQPVETPLPGCVTPESFKSSSYIECKIKHFSSSKGHPCGGCKMAGGNDSTAVVNERLKVRGVEGLRVVDASIIPSAPTGNLMATVMMISEKASDMISEDHRIEKN